MDRQGMRGIFFASERVELNLSLNATPPVDSEENRARTGMPHLDPTLELGPRLDLRLATDPARSWALELRIPARAAIATDFSHTKGIGYVLSPHLSLTARPMLGGERWNLGLQAGPIYASSEYHQYFYGVEAAFAAPGRQAYSAPGGYSGAYSLASLSRRWGRYWIGAFARYDSLRGAVFEASPLVRRDHSVMGGIALAWVFARSERLVGVDVDE